VPDAVFLFLGSELCRIVGIVAGVRLRIIDPSEVC